MAKKRKKSKALKPISKVRNKLFKLWSNAVLSRSNWTCEYCGIKKGDINKNGKITKIDAHHLFSRNIKDAILKFDIRNGIAVCPICHKWGSNSFHRNPITTITWFQEQYPDRYTFILNNWNECIDLDNRKVLEAIEVILINKTQLNLNELKQIELKFPRPSKKKQNKIKGSLWDNLEQH